VRTLKRPDTPIMDELLPPVKLTEEEKELNWLLRTRRGPVKFAVFKRKKNQNARH